MPSAYMGKVLFVDLTLGQTREEIIPDDVYRKFLSGLGLAAWILYRDIPAGADPLGPQNVLGFAAGLLVGTNSLFTGRWVVAAKSPLTGTWGEANCGGTLAPAIKRCGYDAIFFTGVSHTPVYLLVRDGKVELRDASYLWGADAVEAEKMLLEAHPHSSVACIGTAGEKRSLIAGICNDGGRLAARSGLGAVMGSKNLKAVVLRGSTPVRVHNAREMQRLSKRGFAYTKFHIPLPPGALTRWIGTLFRVMPWAMAQDGMLYKWMLRQWGTISMNQISVEMGDAPVQNWRGSSKTFPFRRSDTSNPDRIIHTEERKYHCRSCALGCGGIVRMPEDSKLPEGEESHKPEYETVLSWGGLLMNENLESIYRINDRLNRAGMDSISAGATVAFAIECAEQGLLTKEQLDGIDLRWGSAAAVEALLEKMIAREGIGDLLADGSRAAAQRIGQGTETLAMQSGGQELAMHDGRNDPGFALHAAVEPMPGRHTNGSGLYYEMFQLWRKVPGLPKIPKFYHKDEKYRATPNQAKAAVACSRFSQVMNGAGLCLFGAFIGVHRLPVFEWINAAAGWNLPPEELMETGARIQALKQMFNVREGMPLRHAINPRVLGLPPVPHGANQGRSLDMDAMVRAYWQESGWDPETGIPTESTLTTLGLATAHQ